MFWSVHNAVIWLEAFLFHSISLARVFSEAESINSFMLCYFWLLPLSLTWSSGFGWLCWFPRPSVFPCLSASGFPCLTLAPVQKVCKCIFDYTEVLQWSAGLIPQNFSKTLAASIFLNSELCWSTEEVISCCSGSGPQPSSCLTPRETPVLTWVTP